MCLSWQDFPHRDSKLSFLFRFFFLLISNDFLIFGLLYQLFEAALIWMSSFFKGIFIPHGFSFTNSCKQLFEPIFIQNFEKIISVIQSFPKIQTFIFLKFRKLKKTTVLFAWKNHIYNNFWNNFCKIFIVLQFPVNCTKEEILMWRLCCGGRTETRRVRSKQCASRNAKIVGHCRRNTVAWTLGFFWQRWKWSQAVT